ncbi:MAG TPA: hypothetical protein VKA84_25870 [Gemmatimonadaceae bacterium]|nr:hypothetical protein [Gemmatimonadaceae bacterium]
MPCSVRVSSALIAALALAACGGDGTGPNGQELDDGSLAAIAGLPLGIGVVEAGPGSPAVGSTTDLPVPICRYQEGTGRFDCEPITNRGMTITRSFAFLDGAGHPQRRFDPVTTASINTRMSIAGTLTTPQGGTIKLDRRGEITVSGLAGAETSHTLNGVESGTSEFSAPASPSLGAYSSKAISNDTTLDLVIPIPPRPAAGQRPAPVFPLSGKRISNQRITSRFSNSPEDGLTELTMRYVVTYNGTSVVTIEMTLDGQTKTCTVDLMAPSIGSCLF